MNLEIIKERVKKGEMALGINKIRGHMCEGLRKYQEYSTFGCIPDFTEEGYTRGCDDTNYVPILYCPFCGKELPKPKVYNFRCTRCKSEWESYVDWDDDCKKEGCYGHGKEITS